MLKMKGLNHMANKLWEAITPLEAEADLILEDAREKAANHLREARLEADTLAENAANERMKNDANTNEKIQLELRLASEKSRKEAEVSAAAIVAEARPKMGEAVDRVVERILSTRGNR